MSFVTLKLWQNRYVRKHFNEHAIVFGLHVITKLKREYTVCDLTLETGCKFLPKLLKLYSFAISQCRCKVEYAQTISIVLPHNLAACE